MVKGKQQTTKSKPTQKGKLTGQSRPVTSRAVTLNKAQKSNKTQTMKLVRNVCSITDPFCSHADGAKLFGATAVKTLPWQYHVRYPLTTDAAGNASFLFLPGYNAIGAAGTTVGAVQGFGGNPLAGPIAGTVDYRIVSWGFKVYSVVSPLNASGMVRVRMFPATNGTTLGFIDPGTFNCSESMDIPLNSCRELAVIGKRIDYTHQRMRNPQITNPAGSCTDWVAPGWAPILLCATGAPVGIAVLDVEVIFNYEVCFSDDSALALLTTPAPPAEPAVTSASDSIYNASKGIFREGISAASRYVEQQAVRLITDMVYAAPLLLV